MSRGNRLARCHTFGNHFVSGALALLWTTNIAQAASPSAGFERASPTQPPQQMTFTDVRVVSAKVRSLSIQLAFGRLCDPSLPACVPGFRGQIKNISHRDIAVADPPVLTHGRPAAFGIDLDLQVKSTQGSAVLAHGSTLSFIVPLTWLFAPGDEPTSCVTTGLVELSESLNGIPLLSGLHVNLVVHPPDAPSKPGSLLINVRTDEYLCPSPSR